jgi:copper chaperone CopZ
LSKIDGVEKVTVDAKAKTATVMMKEGALTKKTVEEVFKGSRYSVASFEAAPVPLPKTYLLSVSGMT